MAKELPYFKFEPTEWDNGNIQMCSRESKGLFIELCSMYWARLGEVPYALALQKLCNGNKDAMHELTEHEIIGVIEGQIVIEFLDEQLSEFNDTSEKRRNAANKRWKNANALQKQSKSNAIRGEEIREEETRGIKPFVAPEVFGTNAEAHKFLTTNHQDISAAKKVLSNLGWSQILDVDVGALAYHFCEKNLDITTKPKSDVRKHFQNWLNKVPIVELQAISKRILTNHERKQRSN